MSRLPYLTVLALAAACNPYSPDLGNDPFECGSEGECPEGYTCEIGGGHEVCVESATTDIDASVTQFTCNDDRMVEPNNDPSSPSISSIPQQVKFVLLGLAICPVGDRDHFRFGINTNGTDFEATVVGVANRSPLSLQVLNNSGVMVATGVAEAGQPHIVKVTIPSGLASGTYMVAVAASDTTENNYDLTMKICDTLPCPP